jgi:hypothetical protein
MWGSLPKKNSGCDNQTYGESAIPHVVGSGKLFDDKHLLEFEAKM